MLRPSYDDGRNNDSMPCTIAPEIENCRRGTRRRTRCLRRLTPTTDRQKWHSQFPVRGPTRAPSECHVVAVVVVAAVVVVFVVGGGSHVTAQVSLTPELLNDVWLWLNRQ